MKRLWLGLEYAADPFANRRPTRDGDDCDASEGDNQVLPWGARNFVVVSDKTSYGAEW